MQSFIGLWRKNTMKLKILSLLIGTIWLTGCAQTVYKTDLEIYCPEIQEYGKDFNQLLADEVEQLPDSGTVIETALIDYLALRDRIKICQKERRAREQGE